MKKNKRVIALIMTIIMVLGMLPAAAADGTMSTALSRALDYYHNANGQAEQGFGGWYWQFMDGGSWTNLYANNNTAYYLGTTSVWNYTSYISGDGTLAPSHDGRQMAIVYEIPADGIYGVSTASPIVGPADEASADGVRFQILHNSTNIYPGDGKTVIAVGETLNIGVIRVEANAGDRIYFAVDPNTVRPAVNATNFNAITIDPVVTSCDLCSHSWIAAGCDTAKTCALCGETEGTALGHTQGQTTIENNTTASYERVVYCSGCGEELSREMYFKTTAEADTNHATKYYYNGDGQTEQGYGNWYWQFMNGGSWANLYAHNNTYYLGTTSVWNYTSGIRSDGTLSPSHDGRQIAVVYEIPQDGTYKLSALNPIIGPADAASVDGVRFQILHNSTNVYPGDGKAAIGVGELLDMGEVIISAQAGDRIYFAVDPNTVCASANETNFNSISIDPVVELYEDSINHAMKYYHNAQGKTQQGYGGWYWQMTNDGSWNDMFSHNDTTYYLGTASVWNYASYINSTGKVAASHGSHRIAICYEVPETAIYELSTMEPIIGPISEQSTDGVLFAIYRNDIMVWPEDGEAYNLTAGSTLELENVRIAARAGDMIRFSIHPNAVSDNAGLHEENYDVVVFDPVVTYYSPDLPASGYWSYTKLYNEAEQGPVWFYMYTSDGETLSEMTTGSIANGKYWWVSGSTFGTESTCSALGAGSMAYGTEAVRQPGVVFKALHNGTYALSETSEMDARVKMYEGVVENDTISVGAEITAQEVELSEGDCIVFLPDRPLQGQNPHFNFKPVIFYSAPEYTISLADSVGNGTLYVNGSNAENGVTVQEGDIITVVPMPDNGYAMRGGSLAISWGESTEYLKAWTFTMPAGDVTVSCEYYAFSKDTIDGIQLGDVEWLYADSNLPVTMDSPMTEFWKGDETTGVGETWYMVPNPPWHRFYKGNAKTFLQGGPVSEPYTITHGNHTGIIDTTGHYVPHGTNAAGYYSGLWMMNIYDPEPEYDPTGNMRLALCHREDYTTGWYFAFGVAVSMDQGETWKYLGDSVAPSSNNHERISSNIGGFPYIVTEEDGVEYLQIFFNESYIDEEENKVNPFATARIAVSDLISAANSDTTPVFTKYANGAWNTPGMVTVKSQDVDGLLQNGNLGSHMLPAGLYAGEDAVNNDSHSDAVYCEPLGKYLMTSSVGSKLYMYASEDGVTWNERVAVLEGSYLENASSPYSFFLSGEEKLSKDGSVVGNEFYIYCIAKTTGVYAEDQLYRRKITVSDLALEPVNRPRGTVNDGWTCGAGVHTDSTVITLPASGETVAFAYEIPQNGSYCLSSFGNIFVLGNAASTDGVGITIMLNDTELHSFLVEAGEVYDLEELVVNAETGDVLYFCIDKNGTADNDVCSFEPVVTCSTMYLPSRALDYYHNDEGVTEQGYGGWYWQLMNSGSWADLYANNNTAYYLGTTSVWNYTSYINATGTLAPSHDGRQMAIVYEVPADGIYGVSTASPIVGPTNAESVDGVQFQILHNSTNIYPDTGKRVIAVGETLDIGEIRIEASAGDRIYFAVDPNTVKAAVNADNFNIITIDPVVTPYGVCTHYWTEADCDTPKMCPLCGETEGVALGHTAASAVVESDTNESYERVVYCSVCEGELSRDLFYKLTAELDVNHAMKYYHNADGQTQQGYGGWYWQFMNGGSWANLYANNNTAYYLGTTSVWNYTSYIQANGTLAPSHDSRQMAVVYEIPADGTYKLSTLNPIIGPTDAASVDGVQFQILHNSTNVYPGDGKKVIGVGEILNIGEIIVEAEAGDRIYFAVDSNTVRSAVNATNFNTITIVPVVTACAENENFALLR